MSTRQVSLVISVLFLVGPVRGRASVLRVPEAYPTIQEAIDVSAVGDSVLVGPGTWDQRNIRVLQVCFMAQNTASVAFLKPGITLLSAAGPDVTVLDGGPEDLAAVDTVLLASLDGPPTRLEGFTVTGGGDGLGVGCTNSPVEAVNCRFVENGLAGLNVGYAEVSLIDCVVSHNPGPNRGARIAQGSDFEAIRTRFEANSYGGIRSYDSDRVYLEDCEFVDHPVGRAIEVLDCPDVTLRGSLFLRNSTQGSQKGGAMFARGCASSIEFCTFAYDSSISSHVGAVYISGGLAVFENNTFYRCSTPGSGGGIGLVECIARVRRNIAVECTGAAFAEFSVGNLVASQSGCNLFWNNTAPYHNWDPAATVGDVHADPEFCDPEALDFTVLDTSPAAAANSGSCGQIGAHGIGCGAVSVEPSTWGRLKANFRIDREER